MRKCYFCKHWDGSNADQSAICNSAKSIHYNELTKPNGGCEHFSLVKGCPYCGSMDLAGFEMIEFIPDIPNTYYVKCNQCGANGPSKTSSLEAWDLFLKGD